MQYFWGRGPTRWGPRTKDKTWGPRAEDHKHPLKVDYFAIYYTYSALIHFTIHVHLCRRWAAACTFLLSIAPWQEISKTTMKQKLAISDRNNDYFYTNWLKKVFLTGFEKASDINLQYTLLCEIFRKTQ